MKVRLGDLNKNDLSYRDAKRIPSNHRLLATEFWLLLDLPQNLRDRPRFQPFLPERTD